MQTYLILPSREPVLLGAPPQTRGAAIALAKRHIAVSNGAKTCRIVSLEEFEVSSVETCEVEVFAVGLRNYGAERWGLVEASTCASHAFDEFSPTCDDVALWLNALRDCWQTPTSSCSCELTQVDDFHVLQLFEGSRLLTSITWNEGNADTAFRIPNTLEMSPPLWGDALLPKVGLLYKALDAENFFSFRK